VCGSQRCSKRADIEVYSRCCCSLEVEHCETPIRWIGGTRFSRVSSTVARVCHAYVGSAQQRRTRHGFYGTTAKNKKTAKMAKCVTP
jgi:hypothetical protein